MGKTTWRLGRGMIMKLDKDGKIWRWYFFRGKVIESSVDAKQR